jgi:hypothetical protein
LEPEEPEALNQNTRVVSGLIITPLSIGFDATHPLMSSITTSLAPKHRGEREGYEASWDQQKERSEFCPSSVRKLPTTRPKGNQEHKRDSQCFIGFDWLASFHIGPDFPLITQRSLVQIQPPQPF